MGLSQMKKYSGQLIGGPLAGVSYVSRHRRFALVEFPEDPIKYSREGAAIETKAHWYVWDEISRNFIYDPSLK